MSYPVLKNQGGLVEIAELQLMIVCTEKLTWRKWTFLYKSRTAKTKPNLNKAELTRNIPSIFEQFIEAYHGKAHSYHRLTQNENNKKYLFYSVSLFYRATIQNENLESMPNSAAWRICILHSLRAGYGQSCLHFRNQWSTGTETNVLRLHRK